MNRSLNLIRSFSSSAVSRQLVKPPTQVHGIEGKYATALYSAATKAKTLDATEKDVSKVHEVMMKDKKLNEFCCDPSIKRSLKVQAWTGVLDKLGIGAQSKNMFVLLAENGRLNIARAVTESFASLMSAHRGEVPCIVTTAKPLDKSTESQLMVALKDLVKSDQQINLKLEVNPQLIGGMTVSIGDRFVDMSIQRKVRQYEQLISQPV